jgi:hypothetical protein
MISLYQVVNLYETDDWQYLLWCMHRNKSYGNHVTFPIYIVKMFCEGPVPLLVLLSKSLSEISNFNFKLLKSGDYENKKQLERLARRDADVP